MKVCLDEFLTVDCDGFLNGGEKWNGWEQPIFNAEQLQTIREWYTNEKIEEESGVSFDDEVIDLGEGQFFLSGWTWQIDPDYALCDDCGDSIYWSDPQGKWLHEDTESNCFLSSSCVMGNGNTMKRKATR